MKKIILVFLLLFTTLIVNAGIFSKKPTFLKADQAFQFSDVQKAGSVSLHWDIADGYYLYKKSFEVKSIDSDVGEIVFPPAEKYHDEFFGEVDIYRQQLVLAVPVKSVKENAILEVTYQGCTVGFCYPPETKIVSLLEPTLLSSEQSSQADSKQILSEIIETSQKKTALSLPVAEQDRLAEELFKSKYSVFWFFLLGLGLAFTPCVLPMLPLLSAIVIGGQIRPNSLRALTLSFVYVQGMALTYTLLGLIVAAIGLPFQVVLQSPYVLLTLSMIFVLLALSMFGFFTLQLPTSLQTKLMQYSQQQKSGAFSGVFVMGMIAGLVASPCTSAPLSGALLYVAQSGDVLTGAITLYLLALGMGVPLILITVFGNKILPKSGNWMLHVKHTFGFVLLALPVFLVSRVFPNVENHLWFILAIGFCLWIFFHLRNYKWAWIAVFMMLVFSTFFPNVIGIGFLSGNAIEQLGHPQRIEFKKIKTYEELQQVLRTNHKSLAMLDLYADWCVACKEFEKYTFHAPEVVPTFNDVLLLQIDMTKNTSENKMLLDKLNILGLPTILFFNSQGGEIPHSRITGFMDASIFNEHLKQLKKIINSE